MSAAQVFYQCQRCGNCCRWPGHVKLTPEDVERLAAFLLLSVPEFTRQYTGLHPQRTCLILKTRENGECIFLEGLNTCLVNAAKPQQCSDFPNKWNYPGWRDHCEAIPLESEDAC